MEPLNAALDVALIVMRNGGSTGAAEQSFRNTLKAYKKADVLAIWRLDFIAATTITEGAASTSLRPVGPIGVHLLRVSAASVLAERAATGEISTAALAAEVERIKQLPSPYNRWVTVAAAAGSAASFSQIPGGDWGSLGISFVAAGVGQFFRSLLQARKLAAAPVTLICALLSAIIASIGLRLGYSQVAPATLIAAVIYMAPGVPLINGFVDMISHKYLFVGIERMLNAAFLFLIMAAAIGFANVLILK